MAEHQTDYEFRAETRKVLNILTHSLYTNREIFLRELISNASDALDKLRFLQGKGETPRSPDLPLEITLSTDKVQNCLTVADTGVGMTREELVDNLGTIARSGSERFLAEHARQEAKAEEGAESGTADASGIIGRFGIGFYSVFMAADRVEVTSRPAFGNGEAFTWTSDGTGSFTVVPSDAAQPERGTIIRIFLKEDAKEFLEKYRLEGAIRKHSAFIGFPLLLDGERVNTTAALWREPRFSVTREQYAEFYKFLTYDTRDPMEVIHLSVDAPVQFAALLFIPDSTDPFFGPYNEHWGPDLYVRRVLIMRENKELLPDWLAFLKGVVDTEDLPLNISRETLQENVVLRTIGRTVTKQVLDRLEKLAESDAEKYDAFWRLHGKTFRLGYADPVNRDRVAKLLRFNSSTLADGDALTSLDGYISRAKPGQKEIWYTAAPSREAARVNPHLELFTRKGLEVLYLYEPVDEFALESLGSYEKFTFKAVEHADGGTLDSFRDEEEAPAAPKLDGEGLAAFEALIKTMDRVLEGQVKEVRVSHRLTDSPACLVNADGGLTSSMDRILRVMHKDDAVPLKIFEVNRDHPLLRNLMRLNSLDSGDPQLAAMIQSLLDAALLLDGTVRDPHALARRSTKLLEQAGEWYAGLKSGDKRHE